MFPRYLQTLSVGLILFHFNNVIFKVLFNPSVFKRNVNMLVFKIPLSLLEEQNISDSQAFLFLGNVVNRSFKHY